MTRIFQLGFVMLALGATPVMAEWREPLPDRIVVRTADLDLRSEGGQRVLDRRLTRAVIEACGTASNVDLAGANEVTRCLQVTGKYVASERNQRIAAASSSPILLAGR